VVFEVVAGVSPKGMLGWIAELYKGVRRLLILAVGKVRVLTVLHGTSTGEMLSDGRY
jgi:hypothetical protein